MAGATGHGYAHEYDGWLALFKLLACSSEPYALLNAPSCWAPFLLYLGHDVASVRARCDWDCDEFDWRSAYLEADDRRRVVEVASTVRPELVHALYCADTEWPCPMRQAVHRRSFPVTCNGSFFRPEVQAYRETLLWYRPGKRKAVIVPCSAQKPYPSAAHAKVIQRLPDSDWHLIIATGVLGLVPQELWKEMPHYDSGVPNLQRVTDTVRWYFTRHEYESVVVFSDFYATAVRRGLEEVGVRAQYILGSHYRDTYENLTLPEHLDRLEQALRQE